MKLKNKVLLVVGLVWLIFLAVTYTGSHLFLLHSFLKLEKDRVERDLSRIDEVLDQLNFTLYTYAADWAHWDEAYRFLQNKNPSFVKNNFTIPAFLNSTINFISYWNNKHKLMAEKVIDIENEKLITLPKNFKKYLRPGSMLFSIIQSKKDFRGYILLPKGVMMIAVCTVTNGKRTQQGIGTAIFGRFLSKKLLQKMQNIIRLDIKLLLPKDIKNKQEAQYFKVMANNKTGHFLNILDDNHLEAFTLIRDLNKHPIAMIKMSTSRLIVQTGVKAIRYYLFAFIFLGILFSLLMLWLLRLLIILKLENLAKTVTEVAKENTLSRRISIKGKDELSALALQINVMLDIIQFAQEKLELKVFERTKELQQMNVKLYQEIIERKSVEKELTIHKEHLVRLAHYDHLTSLPNRVFFNDILNKAIRHAESTNQKLAILFIDLDRFKNINDSLGHSMGDLVLKEIAARFLAVLTPNDVLARLGGDEFIILLNDILNLEYAKSIAEKILLTCLKPIYINKFEFFITTSIGISIYKEDGNSLEELQKNADIAMYKAKREGGGVYCFYTKELNTQMNVNIKLESALRKAIQLNEFTIYYQPKVDLKTGMIQGVEALLRFENEELGSVNPETFIPIAEETGLIISIGEWTLRTACATAYSWQKAGYLPITIAVNLSAKQFQQENITQLIASILQETKLQPQYLELEITETAIMDNAEKAITRLKEIANMGIKIVIDDFGTGYTSINYLKQFPVSILKIDQTFIKGLPTNPNDIAITSAVISLGHNLGLKIVAEGVETKAQLQFLIEHECDYAQGYYLSHPLPPEKIILQFLKK